MKILLETSLDTEIKADIVRFYVSVHSYDKDTIGALNKVYENYDKIVEILKDNKFMRIKTGVVSTVKHKVEETVETTNETSKRTTTQYTYKGFDSHGYVMAEMYIKHISEEILNNIYNLMAKNTKTLTVNVTYSFEYSDNLVKSTEIKLRKGLIEKAKKTAIDLYANKDIVLEEIRYGINSNVRPSYGRAKLGFASERECSSTPDLVISTAALAYKLITLDNAPSKILSDSVETHWIIV